MRSKNWRAAFFLNVACLPFYAYIYSVHFDVGTKDKDICATVGERCYIVGTGTVQLPNGVRNMYTRQQLEAVFFSITPEANVTTDHALTDPESFFWRFELSDGWYTYQEWSDVCAFMDGE